MTFGEQIIVNKLEYEFPWVGQGWWTNKLQIANNFCFVKQMRPVIKVGVSPRGCVVELSRNLFLVMNFAENFLVNLDIL